MVASGASPRTEVAPVANGILQPESAASLMAVAQRAAGTRTIDMRTFSYGGNDRFRRFELAWMTTVRVRQADGSDAWADIECSTMSMGTIGPWVCSAREARTVAVAVNGAARTLEFVLENDMSGDQAREVITAALNDIYQVREIGVCDSKKQSPVELYLLNGEPWRGADGYFKHQGEQFLLRTNFYSFRFSFDAKASPQVSMTCLEPVEELE